MRDNLVRVEEVRVNNKIAAVRIILSDGRVIFTDGNTLELIESFPHVAAEVRVKL
jgi:hypothetical protein